MASSEAPREAATTRIFHCRLIPPRPDFAFTMTDEERELARTSALMHRGRPAQPLYPCA